MYLIKISSLNMYLKTVSSQTPNTGSLDLSIHEHPLLLSWRESHKEWWGIMCTADQDSQHQEFLSITRTRTHDFKVYTKLTKSRLPFIQPLQRIGACLVHYWNTNNKFSVHLIQWGLLSSLTVYSHCMRNCASYSNSVHLYITFSDNVQVEMDKEFYKCIEQLVVCPVL